MNDSTNKTRSARDPKPEGVARRTLRRLTGRDPEPESCDHLHVQSVEDDGSGKPGTRLVCEQCGRELDAGDPAWSRRHAKDPKVCVDCGGTYWTVGARRLL
ncbi:MAG TPA: hypothetical protein VL117_11105 [Thermoleophilia bacterium]|nr:hypothetical protein [Thermoleophilia bacterium]